MEDVVVGFGAWLEIADAVLLLDHVDDEHFCASGLGHDSDRDSRAVGAEIGQDVGVHGCFVALEVDHADCARPREPDDPVLIRVGEVRVSRIGCGYGLGLGWGGIQKMHFCFPSNLFTRV